MISLPRRSLSSPRREILYYTSTILSSYRIPPTWNDAFDACLITHRGNTATQYRIALEDFHEWYTGTYGQDPEPELPYAST
jgi:hypothetical protein